MYTTVCKCIPSMWRERKLTTVNHNFMAFSVHVIITSRQLFLSLIINQINFPLQDPGWEMNPSLLKPLQTVCITFYRGCTPHCWWLLWEEAGTASHLGPLSIHIAKWSIGHWAKAFKNIIKMGFSQLLTCFQCAQGANWQSKDFNTNNTYCSYTSESGVPDTLSFLLFTLRGVLKTSHATDLLTFLLVICVFWCHLPIYSLRERKMGQGWLEVGRKIITIIYYTTTNIAIHAIGPQEFLETNE